MIEVIVQSGFASIIAVALFAAAASDIKSLTIPNWIPVSIVALFLIQAGTGLALNVTEISHGFVPSLIVATATLVMFTLLFALGQMGGGDVKLIAATSLWAGPDLIFGFIVITTLAGGALALFALMRGTKSANSPRPYAGLSSSVLAAGGDTPVARLASRPIPYGVAIAIGGFFVVAQIIRSNL